MNKTIYVPFGILVILAAIFIVPVLGAVQVADIPEGYVRLSDIGTYGTIVPNAEDKLIPKEIAEKLNNGVEVPNIKDANSILGKKENKPKSMLVIKIPDKGANGVILSSANVILSSNITKLWNKTYTGDIDIAWTIPDISGDGLDDALVLVHLLKTDSYTLQVIKGNNGQVLWNFATPPNSTIAWDIIPDVDLDKNRDVLITVDIPSTTMFSSDFIVYMKKGTTGATLWQDTTLKASNVYAVAVRDLNGDTIPDVLIEKNKLDLVTFKSSFEVVAKKGRDGAKLWNDITSIMGFVYGFAMDTSDLDGDKLGDVLVEKTYGDSTTGMATFEVVPKIGKNGTSLWSDKTTVKGTSNGFAYTFGDLNKDGLSDIIIEKWGQNSTTSIFSSEIKARVGKKGGTQLWSDVANIKNGYSDIRMWPVGDVNSDTIQDLLLDRYKCATVVCSTGKVDRTIRVIRGNNGVNIWQKSITTPNGWQSGVAYPIGDMNKDSFFDIFYQNYQKNTSSATDYILNNQIIQAKNGGVLYNENLHGTLNQIRTSPYFYATDLNGDIYKDLLLLYINKGNVTVKVLKGGIGPLTFLWSLPYVKSSSTESLFVYSYPTQDINGDGLIDLIMDVARSKPGSQSQAIQARLGKDATLRWQDSISGITANLDLLYIGDVNADGVDDFLVNARNTSATKKTYLYKVKNAKTGANFWAENLPTSLLAMYGEMYACDAGDLKGNNKVNILKYAHSGTNVFTINAKIAPVGAQLWQITSNKDINACQNTYSNFNGDLKDDILFDTYRDVYAITTK